VSPEGDAGAPEITPAMIDAGVYQLSRLDLEFDPSEQIVRAVYEAMASVRKAQQQDRIRATALEPNGDWSVERG